jgi:DNA polymerase III subunit delta'
LGFDELFGNQRIRNILSSYVKNDIIPYSIIFSGPGSADMQSFALAFAKGVNCLNPKVDGDFCGACQHCQEIEKEIFMDLNIMAPDGQFYKKEQIMFLVEDNTKKPYKGKRKINILTSVHQMNANSANAFLKVLEEPAPENVFILLTNNLAALLPTIKSRCQIIKFSPLSRSEITSYLIESRGYDSEKARLLSYLGQGNMESVLNVEFDTFMEQREKIFNTFSSLLTNRGIETVLLELYNLSRSREKFLDYFGKLVNLLSLMLRDIMVLKIEENSDFVINIDYRDKLMKLRDNISVDRVLVLLRKMEFLLRDIKRNLNTKVLILEFIKSYTGEDHSQSI